MTTTTDEYHAQAEKFLADTGTTLAVRFIGYGDHWGDGVSRDRFRFTLTRNGRKYSGSFGQSLKDSTGDGANPPTAYDILACLTKSDPGDIDDFAEEMGMMGEKPSRIIRVHRAVRQEWRGVESLFGDVLSALQEIA